MTRGGTGAVFYFFLSSTVYTQKTGPHGMTDSDLLSCKLPELDLPKTQAGGAAAAKKRSAAAKKKGAAAKGKAAAKPKAKAKGKATKK